MIYYSKLNSNKRGENPSDHVLLLLVSLMEVVETLLKTTILLGWFQVSEMQHWLAQGTLLPQQPHMHHVMVCVGLCSYSAAALLLWVETGCSSLAGHLGEIIPAAYKTWALN